MGSSSSRTRKRNHSVVWNEKPRQCSSNHISSCFATRNIKTERYDGWSFLTAIVPEIISPSTNTVMWLPIENHVICLYSRNFLSLNACRCAPSVSSHGAVNFKSLAIFIPIILSFLHFPFKDLLLIQQSQFCCH